MIGSLAGWMMRRAARRSAGVGLKALAVILLGLAQAGCLPAAAPVARSGAESEAAVRGRVRAALGQLPLTFVANHGQFDERVGYSVQGRQAALFFTAAGVTFALGGPAERAPGPEPAAPAVGRQAGAVSAESAPAAARQGWVVKLDFVGAEAGAEPVGREPAAAVVSYFKGPREAWQVGLPTYAQVVYENLWPGIDLVYSGTASRLKYDFVVKPGADPDQIRLAYHGATDVRLTESGQLEVTTPIGGLVDQAPYAYQEANGQPVQVAAAYDLEPRPDGAYEYGFRVGDYDRSLPLVLDPVVLVYAGYIGGDDGDGSPGFFLGFGDGGGIAVDGAGNAYVTGATLSDEGGRFRRNFPVEVGPDLTFNGGDLDAFVAKVKADGSGLVYAGYIGGSGSDAGNGIAVDGAGNAYVTGETNSDEASFPLTVGPDLTGKGGTFVAKVAADGTELVYAGYIDGTDEGNAIAVDSEGNAYVTGLAFQTGFPATVGPDLTFNGDIDAFVAKVRADGTGFVYAGYIGGAESDFGNGIAVDSAGNAYVTGGTRSDESSFPVNGGPDQRFSGLFDAFVAKVRADGTGLAYAGYIGGSQDDIARGIAVDGAGNAYVVGETNSSQRRSGADPEPGQRRAGAQTDRRRADAESEQGRRVLPRPGSRERATASGARGEIAEPSRRGFLRRRKDFPVKVGPDLTFNGNFDAFIAKVKADGSGLVYAGYIGGSDDDAATGVAVDGAGNAYVTGVTQSDQGSFPVAGGPDLTFNGGDFDAFVAKVKADGSGLAYAGYIGGNAFELGLGIAVDGGGDAYVTGFTTSTQASFPVTVGPDLTYNGNGNFFGGDAFVAKVASDE